jgi:hypothetical protein
MVWRGAEILRFAQNDTLGAAMIGDQDDALD